MRFLQTRKRRIVLLAAVLALVALGIFLEPTHIVRGWLEGEQFFRGRPTSYWRTEIAKNNPDVHTAFGTYLGGTPDPAAVSVLIELLKDDDVAVTAVAANNLAMIGPDAWESIPTLLNLLKQPSVYRRRQAANALAGIIAGSEFPEAIPQLIRGLQEDDVFVNYFCAAALGRMGKSAKEALPALSKLSKSERAREVVFGSDCLLRDSVDWALHQIDPANWPEVEKR